ncbi:MAG: site-specific DNA-methyltransferase [Candidatus Pacebacteria bacterium]|nr:site-specific DNA-methyltransferase [Candidatus Paceibacterota bacterium]
MTKEQKFYKALSDVFIGAKVEGKGGFVNLMRIKSNYYRKIEAILKDDIGKALEKYPFFRDELFDKLYSFFSRYFTESGSIYFNSTPFHNNVYEKVYTDEKDVILFWKTQMLYYVKTDRIFRSLPVEFDGFKFYFDASQIENKKANEKRSLVFELNQVREDSTIVFDVQYSEKGTKTKQDEILKAIKRKGIAITDDQLERAFRVFEIQSEVDFFINKNAKAFLQEQFKLWSYQYFWEGAKEWSADRVNELQILKDIAFKIIDFISQFEDELVKIWNKPKFVKNSNYVITLDRIKDISLVERILEHKIINEQIKEWQELGIVDENFKVSDIFTTDLMSKHLSEKYHHLPIDTKYFKDLELEILGQFEDLDKSLDGWLIKSENYQALNTILPKFKEKVQTIYIDPPYNTGSDEFIYKDKFQHASWLTMLLNRLTLSKEFLKESGNICVSINENELYNLKHVLDLIYGDSNYLTNFTIKVRHEERILKGDKDVHEVIEYLLYYRKTDKHKIRKIKIDNTSIQEYIWQIKEIKNPSAVIELGGKKVEVFKPGEYQLMQSLPSTKHLKRINIRGSIRQGNSSGRFFVKYLEPDFEKNKGYLYKIYHMGNDGLGYRYFYIPDKSSGRKNGDYFQGVPANKEDIKEIPYPNYLNMVNDFNRTGYEGPQYFGSGKKPESFVNKIIHISNINQNDLVLDFFLGSGTTSGVMQKIGEKWLGIEMADYYYTTILPRMKETLAGKGNHEPCGISKDVNWQGGGFFKYYELEQYEEALANCKYEDGDLFNSPSKTSYQEYVFLKDEKMLKALEIDYEKEKVKVDLSKLYPNIDIAETLSNLIGKWIRKISDGEVEFEDGTKINTKDLDYKLIKPLIWW